MGITAGLTDSLTTTSLASKVTFTDDMFAQYLRVEPLRPTPTDTLTGLTSGTTESLAGTGFSSAGGCSVIFDFDMEDWQNGSTQGIFQIGNTPTNDLTFFFSGTTILRAIPRSGGVDQQDAQYLRRAFDATSQRTGSTHNRLGFTVTDGTYYMFLNGMPIAYMTSGYTLPVFGESDTAQFGLLNGGSAIGAGSGFVPNSLELFDTPLTFEQMQGATLVNDYIKEDSYDAENFSVGNIGQSNNVSISANTAPVGFSFNATNALENKKDMTLAAYSSPFCSNPSALTDFNTAGGWAWMDYVLNELGTQNPNKKFSSVVGGESGVGFTYSGGQGLFDYSISGDSYVASRDLVTAYNFHLAAYGRTNPYIFHIKGGETDGVTGSGVTETRLHDTLDRVMTAMSPVIGKKIIISGLHALPTGSFANWTNTSTWLQSYGVANGYDVIDCSSFERIDADQIHLSNNGQLELGEAVNALL